MNPVPVTILEIQNTSVMKSIVYIILLWAMALPVSAQRGKDALLIEAAMSVGNEDGTERIFPGMCVKYLAGMGERAQLTASVGIWAFRNWANEPVFFKSILLGYRSNGKRMYIEPAAGVGIYTEKSGVYDYGYKEGYTYYMIDISLEAGYFPGSAYYCEVGIAYGHGPGSGSGVARMSIP